MRLKLFSERENVLATCRCAGSKFQRVRPETEKERASTELSSDAWYFKLIWLFYRWCFTESAENKKLDE